MIGTRRLQKRHAAVTDAGGGSNPAKDLRRTGLSNADRQTRSESLSDNTYFSIHLHEALEWKHGQISHEGVAVGEIRSGTHTGGCASARGETRHPCWSASRRHRFCRTSNPTDETTGTALPASPHSRDGHFSRQPEQSKYRGANERNAGNRPRIGATASGHRPPPTHSSAATANNSSCWRHGMQFPPVIHFASTPRPAA